MAGEERPLTGLSLLEAPVPQPGRGCVIVRQSNKDVRASLLKGAAEHPTTAEKVVIQPLTELNSFLQEFLHFSRNLSIIFNIQPLGVGGRGEKLPQESLLFAPFLNPAEDTLRPLVINEGRGQAPPLKKN